MDWLMTRYRCWGMPGMEDVTIAEHTAIFEAITRHDSRAATSENPYHIQRADERFSVRGLSAVE